MTDIYLSSKYSGPESLGWVSSAQWMRAANWETAGSMRDFNGDGSFGPATTFGTGGFSGNPVAFDFNRDGNRESQSFRRQLASTIRSG
jgi:hypothetical protein